MLMNMLSKSNENFKRNPERALIKSLANICLSHSNRKNINGNAYCTFRDDLMISKICEGLTKSHLLAYYLVFDIKVATDAK